MNNITPVVKNLLIINVILFVATWLFQIQGIPLEQYLAVFYFDSPFFKIWQPITHMFMHANLFHIFFNMFGLVMIGGIVENHFGGKRFFNFYMISGLGAIALQWAVQAFEVYQVTGSVLNDLSVVSSSQQLLDIYRTPMVGASGAVFGILTAFAVLYPNLELMIMFIPVPIKAKYFVPGYIAFELFMGFSRIEGDSVAHFAHLGGALIGFILVKLWRNKSNYYDYYD